MEIKSNGQVSFTARFTVSESELRALDALAGYGDEAFIKHFYEKLGKIYMEPHEEGLRLFLRTVRERVPIVLSRIDGARDVLDGRKKAFEGE